MINPDKCHNTDLYENMDEYEVASWNDFRQYCPINCVDLIRAGISACRNCEDEYYESNNMV